MFKGPAAQIFSEYQIYMKRTSSSIDLLYCTNSEVVVFLGFLGATRRTHHLPSSRSQSTDTSRRMGWIESVELLQTVIECVCKTVENLKNLDIDPGDIKAIGVCNQRETTIVWDKLTGKPLYNAISEFCLFFKNDFPSK